MVHAESTPVCTGLCTHTVAPGCPASRPATSRRELAALRLGKPMFLCISLKINFLNVNGFQYCQI